MLCTCVNGSISQITNFGLQKADLYIFLSFVKRHRGHTGISGGGWGCVLFIKEEEFASFYLSALHM